MYCFWFDKNMGNLSELFIECTPFFSAVKFFFQCALGKQSNTTWAKQREGKKQGEQKEGGWEYAFANNFHLLLLSEC